MTIQELRELNEARNKKQKRHHDNPEHKLQAECFKWFGNNYPDLLIYANANGGYRLPKTAREMSEEGVVSGIPDLFLAHANHGYHGFYIEMKNGKKGRVSEAQEEKMEKLRSEGYRCEVIRTFEEFKNAIDKYVHNL